MKRRKTDPVVIKETCFMALGALVCAILVQAGFLVAQRWSYTVLAGGVIGWAVTVLNFYLMSRGVQKAVSDPDPQHAQLVMKLSYTGRTVLLLGVMVVAFLLPKYIHWLPVVASVFYPTIVILIRRRFIKQEAESSPTPAPTPAEMYDEEGEDGFEKMVGRFARKIDTDYLKDKAGEKNESETGKEE